MLQLYANYLTHHLIVTHFTNLFNSVTFSHLTLNVLYPISIFESVGTTKLIALLGESPFVQNTVNNSQLASKTFVLLDANF